jgi:hypothetical protein
VRTTVAIDDDLLEGLREAATSIVNETLRRGLSGQRRREPRAAPFRVEPAPDDHPRLHPAGLHYGDCFSCALAKVLGAPLLSKGTDFE